MHRILIVEDDDNTRNGLSELLASEGYAVSTAENGVAAWALMQNQRFDVLLCDFCLPGENGVELSSRSLSAYPDMVVFLITAYSNPEIKRDALACGIRRVFKKPIMLDSLFAELEAVFQTSKAGPQQRTIHQGQYINC